MSYTRDTEKEQFETLRKLQAIDKALSRAVKQVVWSKKKTKKK